MTTRTLACLAVLAATSAGADTWHSDPSRSELTVHVAKRGLLSGFAHDHRFEVTAWTATLIRDPAQPEGTALKLVASASSLRDRQRGLSDDDRGKVNARAAGPDVLDAARHPEVVFEAAGLALAAQAERLRGTVDGALTIRGQRRPVRVTVDAERVAGGWMVRGSARVLQSDFGIRPFRAFGGAVGVEDELRVEFRIALAPRPRLVGGRP